MLTQSQTRDFVITRVFDAPAALVWKCFTEPERMKEWFGPKGSVVVSAIMDLRVGGTYHGAMRGPDGKVMWAKFIYREIVPPRRLVWEHSFSDEAGGLTRHPLSPTWPLRAGQGEILTIAHWPPWGGPPWCGLVLAPPSGKQPIGRERGGRPTGVWPSRLLGRPATLVDPLPQPADHRRIAA